MLLKAVNVTNSRGSVLSLPLEDNSGGFSVLDIEGLGPVKATLVSSSFANLDGEQYQSSRRVPRNIQLKLGLNPDYGIGSVKELRDILYQYFMPKSKIIPTFQMYDRFATNVLLEYLDLNIEAYVESCDPVMFTNSPAMDISLMCFDPDFYDPNLVTFNGMSVADATEETLTYLGSIETGVIFNLRPDRALTEFTIYQRLPNGTVITSYIAYALLAGDVFQISSVVGEKSVTVTRAGVTSSVLYSVSPQSGWLTLYPGDNRIRVFAEGAPVPFDIEYINKYGGL